MYCRIDLVYFFEVNLELRSQSCFPVVRFCYVCLRQYASMNEFMCSEHSVRLHRSKKRSTGN